MSDAPKVVLTEIEVLRTELQELADARWDQRESKSGSQKLRAIATRIVLSAKRVESVVRENSFG
jgi:hypothetical protein